MELFGAPMSESYSDTTQKLAQLLMMKAAQKQARSEEFQKQAAESNQKMFGAQNLQTKQSAQPQANEQGLHPGAAPDIAALLGG